MPATDPWRTKDGKVPGADRHLSNHSPDVRYTPGDVYQGYGLDLKTILRKKAAAAGGGQAQAGQARGWGPARGARGGPATMGATVYDPAKYGLEKDTNIVWIEEPRRRFAKNQQGTENFAQVQEIIRQRLTLMGLDYAVVRTGPHEDQNDHDEFGTVMKIITNQVTGRTSNQTSPADLHITLYAGKKAPGKRGEELYLQGHIYLERIPRGDGTKAEEFDYGYLADPSTRRHYTRGEMPACEEWWYAPNVHKSSSGPAPVLALASAADEASGLEEATANLKI